MVGTPKSSGCGNCRKRKKRCDQGLPQCGQCIAAGWKCPGYSKNWKFVEENTQLQSQYRKKRYAFEEGDSLLVPELNNGDGIALYEQYRGLPRSFRVGIFHCLTSEYEHNASLLNHLLHDRVAQSVFPLASHGNFYAAIPNRLGRNLALDASVSCLCHLYLELLKFGSSSSYSTIREYTKSLNALRLCVEDPSAQYESETICASILLQLCELMLNADYGRWTHLTRGTRLLIQNCGPTRFLAPFERTMLEAQRTFIIIQDMNDNRDCFLRRPEWRRMFLEAPAPGRGRTSIALRSRVCDIFVDIPEVISEGAMISARQMSHPDHNIDSSEDIHLVHHRAVFLRDSLKDWYDRDLMPLITPSIQDHPNLVRQYDDILFAAMDCTANAIFITMHELIASLSSQPLDGSNRVDTAQSSAVIAHHLSIFKSSLAFVRSRSRIASKPLEFGLRQILSRSEQMTELSLE